MPQPVSATAWGVLAAATAPVENGTAAAAKKRAASEPASWRVRGGFRKVLAEVDMVLLDARRDEGGMKVLRGVGRCMTLVPVP